MQIRAGSLTVKARPYQAVLLIVILVVVLFFIKWPYQAASPQTLSLEIARGGAQEPGPEKPQCETDVCGLTPISTATHCARGPQSWPGFAFPPP